MGEHSGGYDPFSFDITAALRPTGDQELVVGVRDPTDRGDQPRGKQALKPGSIWYTAVTGIWQTVWLEPAPATNVSAPQDTPAAAPRSAALPRIVPSSDPGAPVRGSPRAG